MNLGHLATRAARFWGDRPAVRAGDTTLTFADLERRSNQLAAALAARGLQPGDRVAMLMTNRIEWYDATFALHKRGLVTTVLDPRHSAVEKQSQLADSGAVALIAGDDDMAALDGVDTSGVDLITTGDPYESLLSSFDGGAVTVDVADSHPLDLKYTSGTTGRAKGVLHTHGSRLAGVRGMLIDLAPSPSDVLLVAGPLQRGSGAMAMQFIATGGMQVVRPGFRADDVLECVPKFGITTAMFVPTMIYKLLESIDDSVDTSSLHTVQYAASPMSPERIEHCLERFGQIFYQSYGSTEAMGGITLLGKSDHTAGAPQLASCGRESMTGQIRVGDEGGASVPEGEIGEVLIRGPSLFSGYWQQEEQTAQAFTADGWYRSGDIGRMDPNGFLYLLDRLGDKIISGGVNIYPNEVENALYSHRDVAEAVVFGVPDPMWGEAVKAVVRLVDGSEVSVETLRAWTRTTLAPFQVPKSIDLVLDELPKTSTGKVLRRAVRERYWSTGRRVH